jgi:hypothetical protein
MNAIFASSIADALAEAEAAFVEATAERPGLVQAFKAAQRDFEDADQRFHTFQLYVIRASHQGNDRLTTAVSNLEHGERALRDAAGARLTRAKQALGNCDWTIECKRAEIAQLALLANPPDPDFRPVIETVKRPQPAQVAEEDFIEMPRDVA